MGQHSSSSRERQQPAPSAPGAAAHHPFRLQHLETNAPDRPAPEHTLASPATLRVAALGFDQFARSAILAAVGACAVKPARCEFLDSADDLLSKARRGHIDVVLLHADKKSDAPVALAAHLADLDAPVRVIFAAEDADAQLVIRMLRAGAADICSLPVKPTELADQILRAARHAARARERILRTQRLRRACRRLGIARKQLSIQVDALCSDLVNAYQELADHMSHVSLASEFSSLIRQELDVESLLRTTLEYLLTKTGPTNAAVFLPTGSDEYSLGAYVNYDMPRDTADMLLDHLADVVAPRFDAHSHLQLIEDPRELQRLIGDDASWLADSTVIVFSCVHKGECLAVAMLFRDRSAPFKDGLLPKIRTMRDLFCEQLARVIHIHNRHLPGSEPWSGFDVDGNDDISGLAA